MSARKPTYRTFTLTMSVPNGRKQVSVRIFPSTDRPAHKAAAYEINAFARSRGISARAVEYEMSAGRA